MGNEQFFEWSVTRVFYSLLSLAEFKERYRKEGKSSEWTLERNASREASTRKWQGMKVGRLGVVQKELDVWGGRARTSCGGSLRRSVAWEGVVLSYVWTVFFWRTTFGGYRRDTETATTERRSTAVGGVRCVEANTNGALPQQDTGGAARYQCQ